MPRTTAALHALQNVKLDEEAKTGIDGGRQVQAAAAPWVTRLAAWRNANERRIAGAASL